jgi:hypothetical protein
MLVVANIWILHLLLKLLRAQPLELPLGFQIKMGRRKCLHTARMPKTFMSKEPAPFNFSGDFPFEANCLSA